MHEKHLFEYAVVRVVPRVEREEFINAGIILYCPGQRFLKVLFNIEESRVRALCGKADIEQLNSYLDAFEQIGIGGKSAIRSSVVQTSRVHPGFCEDPEATLGKLFESLVL
jgi:hypothetical protein